MRELLMVCTVKTATFKSVFEILAAPITGLLLAIVDPCLAKMYVILLSHPILKFVLVGSEFLKLSPFCTVQGSVQGIRVLGAPARSICTCTVPTSHPGPPKAGTSVGCWPAITTVFGSRIATVGTPQAPLSCLQACRFWTRSLSNLISQPAKEGKAKRE